MRGRDGIGGGGRGRQAVAAVVGVLSRTGRGLGQAPQIRSCSLPAPLSLEAPVHTKQCEDNRSTLDYLIDQLKVKQARDGDVEMDDSTGQHAISAF
ncbi:hypothetical protein C8Q79DRAFT_941687 [Trametes meyenii]|nr:hypothetical protein C8Q79DRAFT_941687 [Trametes meyenii]